jgi:hypothetical protein
MYANLPHMKYTITCLAIAAILTSCEVSRPTTGMGYGNQYENDTLITQSLFNDRNSGISEENIQRILAGNYKLPQQLRVAVVKLENPQVKRYYWNFYSDEEYLKTQQSYLDSFTTQFSKSPRVAKVSIIPDLLIGKSPSFTNLRETAVRLQADIVVVYSIASDIYSKYKVFTKPDIKAFATTQLIILDVRTGLVPFSTIVTKDYMSQRKKDEMDNSEASRNIQNQAVLLTINEIGQRITNFLKTDDLTSH